jgi:hypothetical protein
MNEIGFYGLTGFAVDDNWRVRGLAICDEELRRPPALLSKFQRLERLAILGTQIRDISSLKELKGLMKLYLEFNQINDISSLKELKGLMKLYLEFNQINDISSLKELKNLKILSLGHNKISHMPAEFLDLGLEIEWESNSVDHILLYGNPLESPPAEIIDQGNEAIRHYFKSLAGEQQALNEVKVLLVGDGAAGKTSLVKQLLGKTFDKNETQTHGIEINPWNVTADKTLIKIRLWDFGGQEIMHATH